MKLLLDIFINILLFGIALLFGTILTVLWLPIIIFYHIFTLKIKTGLEKLSKYFNQLALSVDQFCNVSLQTPLNWLMLRKTSKSKPFGDEDDTLSYIIGLNYYRSTLSRFGIFWAKFLIWIDFNAKNEGTDHLEKTLMNKYKKDLEAYNRIAKDSKYIKN